MRGRALGFVMMILPSLAAAELQLKLPHSAQLTGEIQQADQVYDLPIAPFENGTVSALRVRGHFVQQAWRVEESTLTLLQLIEPLRESLTQAGYDIRLDCRANECGGFDFRFQTQILPAPAMFVDIFQYQFLSALHPNGNAISVLVTKLSGDTYIQIIRVSTGKEQTFKIAVREPSQEKQTLTIPSAQQGSLTDRLVTDGYAMLDDLNFASGSADLIEGEYDSLKALADFLQQDPTRRIALVGHTDAVGSLAENTALSKRRAMSVVNRLQNRYGISGIRLQAAGVGYLAPRFSNLTDKGRTQNRRVEVILLNTE